jgi:anti-anti-sigma factor
MFEKMRQGAVDIISGDEPLVGDNTDKARRLLEECSRSGQPRIVLDLQKMPLIDSDGLELLLDMQDECIRKGGLIQLAGANPLCRDILRITEVDQQFELFDDVVAAAGSFAQ